MKTMPHSTIFSEKPIVLNFKHGIRRLLRDFAPTPGETEIQDIPKETIIATIGKEKHRDYALAFDTELRDYSKELQAIHWELGGILFWWDYGKLWAADGYDYTSFTHWSKENSDWLPYKTTQIKKLRRAYGTYFWRLNMTERYPDLVPQLLASGNIDKPERIAKFVVDENIREWIPKLESMTTGQVIRHAKAMKRMAKNSIEVQDMTPTTTIDTIVGYDEDDDFVMAHISELDLNVLLGDMRRDIMVRVKVEGDQYRRVITIEDAEID